MIIYIGVAFFPVLIGFLFNNKLGIDKKSKNFKLMRWCALFVGALPMFLIIGFRHESIGADTLNYLNHFVTTDNKDWSLIFDGSRMEPGYIIFVKLLGYLFDDPFCFQVTYSIIYLLCITSFANQLEKCNFAFLYFFATLGIYTFMFTGVRQCLAICICLLSFRYIKRRKIIPFALLVLLAFFFHKSSLLFISAYFIYAMPLNIFGVIMYIALGGVAYFNISIIQEWFNNQLDYDYGVEFTGSGYVFLAVMIIITIFALLMIYSYNRVTKEARGSINISFIALMFWFLRMATRVAERPSYYFLFFTMVILAYGVEAIKDRDQRIIVGTVVGVASMALYLYRFLVNFTTYIPYQTFW